MSLSLRLYGLRKWEQIVVRHEKKKKHESRKSLPDMILHDQVLLFAAGILWGQALGGRRKLLSTGLKPPRQCSQPGSLNPGATLESDGMVKLTKHSQASSVPTSHTRLFKAWTKMVSGQVRVLERGSTRMMHRR